MKMESLEHDGRLGRLERELAALAARLEHVEDQAAQRGWAALSSSAPPGPHLAEPAGTSEQGSERAPAPVASPPNAMRRPRSPTAFERAVSDLTFEDLLGGRLLALVGGIAFLVGVAFLVALAIERGWIDETTRVVLAAVGSTALLAAGVWLYDRQGRTQASLAVVGTAIASLYLTLSAATALYGLVPAGVALPLALSIGGVATALAIRWDARTLAGLGILGALIAPVFVGAGTGIAALVFLPVAYGAAQAVLVWRRWDWLAVAAFATAMPQVAIWVLDPTPRPAVLVVGLSVFAALSLAGGLGHDLRLPPQDGLRPSTTLLVSVTALVLGGLGYAGLYDSEGARAGGLWLAALTCAYLVLAIVALRTSRGTRAIALLLGAIALMLADIAFGVLGNGIVLAAGWSASAVALGALVRRMDLPSELAPLPLTGQLALATSHVLLFDAPPGALGSDGTGTPQGVGAIAAVGVAAFASARLAGPGAELLRNLLDYAAMVALAYASAIAADGVALTLAYAAIAVALAETAKRSSDAVAAYGALGFLALAAAHALTFDAPPDGLVYGADAYWAAALALGALAGAGWRCSRALARPRAVLVGAVAVTLLYLASIGIVTVFQPETGAVEANLGLGVRQQGQALLSALWTICGLTALWVGLRRARRDLRLWGFALLGLAVAKVFLYDLSVLSSVYRVLSFVALGLLLLAAAFAYQRMQPPQAPRTRPRVSV
jgi:hypothetical protein